MLWTSLVLDASRYQYFSPFEQWAPILRTPGDSFVTARLINKIPNDVPCDDTQRMNTRIAGAGRCTASGCNSAVMRVTSRRLMPVAMLTWLTSRAVDAPVPRRALRAART